MIIKRKWICPQTYVLKDDDTKDKGIWLSLNQNQCLDITYKMKQNIREQNALTVLEATKIQIPFFLKEQLGNNL